MGDSVNHPSHYNHGGIEVIDALEAWGLGFSLGNAVKYIARAGKKDPSKTIEDLTKARWYLDREIGRLSSFSGFFPATPSGNGKGKPNIARAGDIKAK